MGGDGGDGRLSSHEGGGSDSEWCLRELCDDLKVNLKRSVVSTGLISHLLAHLLASPRHLLHLHSFALLMCYAALVTAST